MSKPSLAEMMAGFSRKPVELLHSPEQLPKGGSSGEILGKLINMRQLGVLPVRPHGWGSESQSIAVCLIVVDRVHHEEIWRLWATYQSGFGIRVQFYIHAKHPENITSEWARNALVDTKQKPEWNSPEVVRAMLGVLSYAVNDECPCERYLFATESCIPVCSVRDACDALFKEDVSWLEASNIPKTNWEQIHCFATVDSTVVPAKAVWKAVPGWIVLNRRHATELVALNSFTSPLGDLVRAWGAPGPWSERKGGVFAPEEVFFPTMLALLGYLDSNKMKLNEAAEAAKQPLKSPREVLIRSAMYAEFERNGDANPRSFESLTATFVSQCRREGYLFARKFPAGSVTVEEWCRLVLGEETLPSSFTSSVSGGGGSSSSGNRYGTSGHEAYHDRRRDSRDYSNRNDSRSYRNHGGRYDADDRGGANQYERWQETERGSRRDRSRDRESDRNNRRDDRHTYERSERGYGGGGGQGRSWSREQR